MELYARTDRYLVSLGEDANCRIKRSSFRNVFDYMTYRLFGKPKKIQVSERGIDLSSTLLKINEKKKRIEISGKVNAFLVDLLD
jgi:hypothetical protein